MPIGPPRRLLNNLPWRLQGDSVGRSRRCIRWGTNVPGLYYIDVIHILSARNRRPSVDGTASPPCPWTDVLVIVADISSTCFQESMYYKLVHCCSIFARQSHLHSGAPVQCITRHLHRRHRQLHSAGLKWTWASVHSISHSYNWMIGYIREILAFKNGIYSLDIQQMCQK